MLLLKLYIVTLLQFCQLKRHNVVSNFMFDKLDWDVILTATWNEVDSILTWDFHNRIEWVSDENTKGEI